MCDVTMTLFAVHAGLRMLPMIEAHECRNLIDANPVDIPFLFPECGKLLLGLSFRRDGGMALKTFRNVRHVNHLPGIGTRVARLTRLLEVSDVELVIEFDRLPGAAPVVLGQGATA